MWGRPHWGHLIYRSAWLTIFIWLTIESKNHFVLPTSLSLDFYNWDGQNPNTNKNIIQRNKNTYPHSKPKFNLSSVISANWDESSCNQQSKLIIHAGFLHWSFISGSCLETVCISVCKPWNAHSCLHAKCTKGNPSDDLKFPFSSRFNLLSAEGQVCLKNPKSNILLSNLNSIICPGIYCSNSAVIKGAVAAWHMCFFKGLRKFFCCSRKSE